jgi:DNA-binding transcriptional ArsR family regulator
MEHIGYPDSQPLDAVFAALADPTRRAILMRLAKGEAPLGELAAPFAISQPAVSRHMRVLEAAGLVTRRVDRTRRPASLNAEPLKEAVAWLSGFRRFWAGNLDALEALLAELQSAPQGERHDDRIANPDA